jgi:ribonuclease HI
LEIIKIVTDGACTGNPGPGGWCAIIIKENNEKIIIKDGESYTTNNRMELLAVINGIEYVSKNEFGKQNIHVLTDSTYTKNGITEWIQNWIKKNWIVRGNAIKNRDLWERLLKVSEEHNVTWEWVKAHNGHPLNEEADMHARSESIFKASNTSGARSTQ